MCSLTIRGVAFADINLARQIRLQILFSQFSIILSFQINSLYMYNYGTIVIHHVLLIKIGMMLKQILIQTISIVLYFRCLIVSIHMK